MRQVYCLGHETPEVKLILRDWYFMWELLQIMIIRRGTRKQMTEMVGNKRWESTPHQSAARESHTLEAPLRSSVLYGTRKLHIGEVPGKIRDDPKPKTQNKKPI